MGVYFAEKLENLQSRFPAIRKFSTELVGSGHFTARYAAHGSVVC
jgi:hypothetical protein